MGLEWMAYPERDRPLGPCWSLGWEDNRCGPELCEEVRLGIANTGDENHSAVAMDQPGPGGEVRAGGARTRVDDEPVDGAWSVFGPHASVDSCESETGATDERGLGVDVVAGDCAETVSSGVGQLGNADQDLAFSGRRFVHGVFVASIKQDGCERCQCVGGSVRHAGLVVAELDEYAVDHLRGGERSPQLLNEDTDGIIADGHVAD
jgi:hypothetical protein